MGLRRPLWLLFLLCLAAPARAGRDEEVALSGVLQRAHDHIDDSWLRRMMAPAERLRFDEDGGGAQFRHHRQALGVALLVSCAEGLAGPEVLLRSAAGDALPPQLYRCELSCQHGSYSALLTLSPADPLVRPEPRPGRIERFLLASPLLDRTPWPWFHRGDAAAWLAALCALAVLSLSFGILRLSRRPHVPRRPFGAGPPIPGTPQLARAGHEVVLVLRLLGALLLLLVGGTLVVRLGPAPLWGSAATLLSLVLLIALCVGLLLCALGGYFHPRGGAALYGALGLAVVLLALPGVLLLRTVLDDVPALLGEEAPPRQQGHYRLPLQDGPAYVRHGGPLLDLVLLHPGGRSCKGRAPESCRVFGQSVLAPADGLVVDAADRHPDQTLGRRDREHPMGNYLLIASGRPGGERVLLSHLQRGSIAVRPGQTVRAGQVVARVGSSGDSDEPHLSMELVPAEMPLPGRRPPPFCGAAFDPERSTGVPIHLDGYVRVGLLGRQRVDRGVPACGERLAP